MSKAQHIFFSWSTAGIVSGRAHLFMSAKRCLHFSRAHVVHISLFLTISWSLTRIHVKSAE